MNNGLDGVLPLCPIGIKILKINKVNAFLKTECKWSCTQRRRPATDRQIKKHPIWLVDFEALVSIRIDEQAVRSEEMV